jgi:hypothetical protein
VAIWYIWLPFDMFYNHLVHFSLFWSVVPIKIWQPCSATANLCHLDELTGPQVPQSVTARVSWGRCYDFLNIFAEKFSEIIGVFGLKKAKICKKFYHNICCCEKTADFLPKIV